MESQVLLMQKVRKRNYKLAFLWLYNSSWVLKWGFETFEPDVFKILSKL